VEITLKEETLLQQTDYAVQGFLLYGTCFHLWLGTVQPRDAKNVLMA